MHGKMDLLLSESHHKPLLGYEWAASREAVIEKKAPRDSRKKDRGVFLFWNCDKTFAAIEQKEMREIHPFLSPLQNKNCTLAHKRNKSLPPLSSQKYPLTYFHFSTLELTGKKKARPCIRRFEKNHQSVSYEHVNNVRIRVR